MGKTKKILLTQGKYAIVDEGDFEWLSQWKWHAVRKRDKYYATRKVMLAYNRETKKITNQTIYLHRLLMGEPMGKEVDHRDGDSLNNCRFNLRECTHMQNLQNRPTRTIAKSGYKGVTWDKVLKRWFVRCTANGYNHHVGYFYDVKEAALAYNKAALEYHGDFARLNDV